MRKENEEEFFNLAQLKKEIEKLMKTLISLVLTFIMSLTSTSIFWTSVDFEKLNSVDSGVKETPVAYIENDDYVPYQYRNYTQDDTTTREYLDFNLNTEFETVFKTITVMTTATGDPKRGNYVASKPIADALVRVDGVPRYTNKKGQITAPLNREYVELYVEYSGYNPYIEIIEATEEEKTVNLKQPSDDIEIYSAMFEYQGNVFNLMQQPCYILQGAGNSFCVLTAECNVDVERIMFYVNGELVKVNFGNELEFTYDDFNSYSNEDVFSIKVAYEGIMSKSIDVNLKFNQLDVQKMKLDLLSSLVNNSQKERNVNQDIPQFTIGNDAAGTGEIVDIEVDEKKWWQVLLDLFIPNEISILDICQIDTPFQLSMVPNFYEGTIEIVFGVEVDLKDLYKKAKERSERKKLSGDEYKAAVAYSKDYKQQLSDAQKGIDEIEDKLKNINEKDARYWQLMRDKNYYEMQMHEIHDEAQKTGWWSNYNVAKKNYKTAEKAYNEVVSDIRKNYKEDAEFVNNAAKSLQQAKSSAYKALIAYLKDVKGYKQKISEVIDIFKNNKANAMAGSKGFGFKLELSLLGSFKFSYMNWKIVSFSTYAEFLFKPSYNIPFNIGPVPMFLRFELSVGVKFETFFRRNYEPVSFSQACEDMFITLKMGIRIDLAAGLAGIASAGAYGKVDFDLQLHPELKLLFKWGLGIKLHFLLLELEFGYDSEPEEIWRKKERELVAEYSLLARSAGISDDISANQLFDRIYQGSHPQLIKLADGRQMLIWIEDDISRDTYNRSVIKYSLSNDGEWSEPKAVFDNGKGDYAFDVCVKGDEVFIAMQKSNKILTQNDDNESMIRAAEIYAAKYNIETDTFVDLEQLTDNDSYDALPQFAVTDGTSDVTLLWQNNTKNDCLGMTGKNIIYSSQYHGNAWSNRIERFFNNRMIYSYSAKVENGDLTIAVCADKDGDILTADMYTVVANGANKVFENNEIANPKFIKLSSGIAFAYYRDGNIIVSTNYIDETIIADGIASQEFSVSKDEENPAIFYEASDGELERGYCVLNVDGKWASSFSVIDEAIPDTDISSLNGYYDDGIIYSTYNFRQVDSERFTDTPLVLCVAMHERGYKIYTEALASDGILDGKQADIRLYVENIGDCDVSRITVQVCGQLIEIDCENSLSVGEGKYFDISFIAKIGHDGCINVGTAVIDEYGAVVATDEFSIFVRYTSISLNAEMSVVNGKQQFRINIQNISDVDSMVTFGIYINGKFYKSERIFMLAQDKVELTVKFDEIKIDDYVYFVVDADVEEFNTFDNGAGIYSVQTETLLEEPVSNIYRQQLQEIRKLMR